MGGFSVVLQQIGVLATVLLIGFVVTKTGYLKAEYREGISKLIIKVLLPCLIISSITQEELNSELLSELLIVAGMSVFCIFILFGIGIITAKILKIPDKTKTVHKLLFGTGNVVFLGYPVIVAMYGDKAFVYAIIYWLINDMILWTIGVFMLSGKREKGVVNTLRRLVNPNTVSFVIAILMLVFGIKLPPIIDSVASGVGGLTTHLSMIFIGMTLATVNAKNALRKWWVFLIVAIKLILMPILFIFIFKGLGINTLVLGVVVLEAAMPAQAVLTILANENKADYEYSAVAMFVTTISSLVTLPFISYILQTI